MSILRNGHVEFRGQGPLAYRKVSGSGSQESGAARGVGLKWALYKGPDVACSFKEIYMFHVTISSKVKYQVSPKMSSKFQPV